MQISNYCHKILDIDIVLINYVDSIVEDLALLFSYSFTMTDRDMNIKEHMEIRQTINGFVYIWNEKTYYDIHTKEELFWILNEVLYGELITENKDWLLLHAAAISFEGKAICFVAESKTGKSTFVSALNMLPHCEYITDDLLPIRKKDLLCCNYCKPISVRESSMHYEHSVPNCRLKEIAISYNSEKKKVVFPNNVSEQEELSTIIAVVFLNRSEEYLTPVLNKLPNHIALSKIVKSFIFSAMEDIPINSIRLVKTHKFYQLNYSGVEELDMGKLLKNLINYRVFDGGNIFEL